MDGTLFFVEGVAGFATSIALVSQAGKALMGVVYDPVSKTLYQASHRGFLINGERFTNVPNSGSEPMRLVVDQSLKGTLIEDLIRPFEVVFVGGTAERHSRDSVTRTCYLKAPKSVRWLRHLGSGSGRNYD